MRPLLDYRHTITSLRLALEEGADPNEQDQDIGNARLHVANDLEEVKLLIEHGADIDLTNNAGETPLVCRIFNVEEGCPDSEEVALYLIEQGADIHIGCHGEGIRPIHLASSPVLIDALLAKGASINELDWEHRTPLHWSSSEAETQLLLDRGADVQVRDVEGNTPLHRAREAGTVVLLAEHGADLSATNYEGQTPEQYMREEGCADAASALEKIRNRHQLLEVARRSRSMGEDLASPEQALAARQEKYGRAM